MSFSTVCLPMALIFTAVLFVCLFVCMHVDTRRSKFNFRSSGITSTFKYNFNRDSQETGFLLIPKDIKYYKQARKGIIWDGDTEQICWKLTGSSHLVFGGGKKGKWAPIYEKRMAGFLSVIFCLCMLAYVPQSFPLDPLLLSKLFSWEIQLGHIQNLNLLRRD